MITSLRVAAVGDLHCTLASEGAFQPLFAKVRETADVLALCGDLTDYGTADEARVLAKELGATKLPKIAVLGNHDFESSASDEVARILRRFCRGPLTSRAQYLVDVQLWGYEDARLLPHGSMSEEDASIWTAAIDEAASRPIGADALAGPPA